MYYHNDPKEMAFTEKLSAGLVLLIRGRGWGDIGMGDLRQEVSLSGVRVCVCVCVCVCKGRQ